MSDTAKQADASHQTYEPEQQGFQSLLGDLFYAYVGHVSLLMDLPGYYSRCINEGKRCVEVGKQAAQEATAGPPDPPGSEQSS